MKLRCRCQFETRGQRRLGAFAIDLRQYDARADLCPSFEEFRRRGAPAPQAASVLVPTSDRCEGKAVAIEQFIFVQVSNNVKKEDVCVLGSVSVRWRCASETLKMKRREIPAYLRNAVGHEAPPSSAPHTSVQVCLRSYAREWPLKSSRASLQRRWISVTKLDWHD